MALNNKATNSSKTHKKYLTFYLKPLKIKDRQKERERARVRVRELTSISIKIHRELQFGISLTEFCVKLVQ